VILAIASGKGGTGKTTVASSLAWVWPRPVTAVDLDVEEPNMHLFLRPEIAGSEIATIEVPVADESKCTYCRACAEICQFKAISVLGSVLLTFPEMCHGCGGCIAVCPEKALTAGSRELGEIRWGRADGRIDFFMGRLRVGEAMSPPLMRAVMAKLAGLDRGPFGRHHHRRPARHELPGHQCGAAERCHRARHRADPFRRP
jgi:MinD superfamily P-loop ATPase